MKKNKRNKLERKLDEYNHIMELVRTIIPVILLVMQSIILFKIFNQMNSLDKLLKYALPSNCRSTLNSKKGKVNTYV